MKTLAQTIALVVVLFVLAVVLDQVTPLQELSQSLEQHPEPYRTITLVLSAAGWVLLLLALLLGFLLQSRSMSEDEARRVVESGRGEFGAGRFYGKARGRAFRGVAAFGEIKQAVAHGAWLRDPGWYPMFLGLAALPLIAFGMFGFFLVVGPPLVKVLCAGALLYATVRTVWAFWKA